MIMKPKKNNTGIKTLNIPLSYEQYNSLRSLKDADNFKKHNGYYDEESGLTFQISWQDFFNILLMNYLETEYAKNFVKEDKMKEFNVGLERNKDYIKEYVTEEVKQQLKDLKSKNPKP